LDPPSNSGRARREQNKTSLAVALASSVFAIGWAGAANAQAKSLTMCWAAWDPANALVELDKDFTKLTGIEMKHEFVPWTSYADHFINLLNSRSSECDLIIGDSQWIGGSAENKRYVKLNDQIPPTHTCSTCRDHFRNLSFFHPGARRLFEGLLAGSSRSAWPCLGSDARARSRLRCQTSEAPPRIINWKRSSLTSCIDGGAARGTITDWEEAHEKIHE
jgi:hypothetical protein